MGNHRKTKHLYNDNWEDKNQFKTWGSVESPSDDDFEEDFFSDGPGYEDELGDEDDSEE